MFKFAQFNPVILLLTGLGCSMEVSHPSIRKSQRDRYFAVTNDEMLRVKYILVFAQERVRPRYIGERGGEKEREREREREREGGRERGKVVYSIAGNFGGR